MKIHDFPIEDLLIAPETGWLVTCSTDSTVGARHLARGFVQSHLISFNLDRLRTLLCVYVQCMLAVKRLGVQKD
eukprot:1121451-Pleurochrysis_carterae.AAC.7